MTTFHSIDELLKMMSREQLLLKQMFGKRKQQSFRREYALELTEYKLQRIQSLIDHGVLRENGSFLEMEDIYLHFFEQVLEVNEEINTSFVNEHISYLKDTISFIISKKTMRKGRPLTCVPLSVYCVTLP